jgi:hypothetical protein
MVTLNINIPNSSYKYLSDDDVFQSVITEAILDYVEKKQDLETKSQLSKNVYFSELNAKFEEKL